MVTEHDISYDWKYNVWQCSCGWITSFTKNNTKDRAEVKHGNYLKAFEPKPEATRQSILDEASQCVNIDRTANYGPPESNFKRIAEIWSVILGTPVSSVQVAQCMVGMKLARLVQSPFHHDSWVDIAGYAACGGELQPPEVEL